MSIVRQGTLPVGSLDHAITLNVQGSGGSHFETVTDTTPYLHRASPQDVASSMKLKKVVGGTIAWNQIGGRTKFPTTHGENGISISWADDETVSISGTASSVSWINVSVTNEITADNHIYLVTATNKPSDLRFGVLVHDGSFSFRGDGTAPYYLFKNTTGWKSINIRHLNGVQYDYQTKFQVYDLTQMFGSTIADYIYSLEQAHAGDGVAWFKALFGEDYYPYNAGELLSVKTSARKTYNADNVEIGSYALDGNLTLRGIPKLDSNNELYYDGDTYASDGTVTRKYGIVDLGTLNWNNDPNRAGVFHTSGISSTIKKTPSKSANLVCGKYIMRDASVPSAGNLSTNDKQISSYPSYGGGYVYIIDTAYGSSTAEQFKTAMSGVYLVYELATPTTESADAYTQSQRVGATEEFVDGRTVEIPVGNVSEYKRLIQGDTP